jgi:putative methanogenesis marker protein 5
MDICEGNFAFDNLINTYCSSELPSGVRGRLYLFSRIIDKADAAIIIGKRPKSHPKMYDALNDLILFGGNSCNNAHSLEVKIVNDLDIPTLRLKYPTNRDELISLIDKTNCFLKDLKDSNPDDLTVDLIPKKDKMPFCDVKAILNRLI